MSDFVLDASVAASWAFHDEASVTAHRALAEFESGCAFVPPIFTSELTNVLLTATDRGRLGSGEARQFLAYIEDLDIREMGFSADLVDLFDLAASTKLTSYDASYLVVARETGRRIATDDARMRRAAKKSGIELI